MNIEIRPVIRERWHGLPPEQSLARPVQFQPTIDPDRMEYALDISKEELEKIAQETGWDLSLSFVPNRPHPFWDSPTMKIVLERDVTTVMDISNPINRLKYAAMTRTPLVAKTEAMVGEMPEATHYIYSEEEEIKDRQSVVARKNNARKMMFEAGSTRKAFIIKLLTGRQTTSRSQDWLDTVIDELIDTRVDDVLKYASFDDSRITGYVLVDEGVRQGQLQREGTSIFYGADRIGFDTEAAVDYLEQPINAPLRNLLIERLKL